MISLPKIIFLFLLTGNVSFLAARDNFISTDSSEVKNLKITFYNGFGVGYGEKTGIFDEHVNFFINDFCIGGRIRTTFRKDWRTVHYAPYYTYHESKFINEYAPLIGYRVKNELPLGIVVTAGPVRRREKARGWPDKGSGSAPLIGWMLQRNKNDDVIYNGFTAAIEFSYVNPGKIAGVSLYVFGSYTKDFFRGGVTVDLLLGKFE